MAETAQVKGEAAQLKDLLTQSDQARSDMAKTLGDKTNDIANTKSTFQDEIEKGKKREIDLEAEKSFLKEQLCKLTIQLNETQAQFASLVPPNETAKSVKRLEQELRIYQKKLARTTSLYNRLKNELKGLAGIITQKNDVLTAKNKEIKILKERLDSITTELAGLENEDDSQKAQAKELKKQVEVILRSPQ